MTHIQIQRKELSRDLQTRVPRARTLSMGMSQDWRLAVQHGSNMVRIGTALFQDSSE